MRLKSGTFLLCERKWEWNAAEWLQRVSAPGGGVAARFRRMVNSPRSGLPTGKSLNRLEETLATRGWESTPPWVGNAALSISMGRRNARSL